MLNSIKGLFAGAFAMALAAGCSYDDGLDAASRPGRSSGGASEETFSVKVGATSSEHKSTRAEYDGVTYKWSPGDRAGFYMVPTGGSAPIVANSPLTSMNTTPQRFAEFDGELTRSEIEAVDPAARYDYYSYYPYGAAADAGFPNVAFQIPSTMTLTPDVFPQEYGIMYATKETTAEGSQPLTWLADGQQEFGESVGFKYNHVFAFLEVHLALNLMSQPIGKIVVTCTDDSPISGTAHINLQTGAVNFVAGQSSSLTVNITGRGLDIWRDKPADWDVAHQDDPWDTIDENDGNGEVKYNKIWIPISPALANKEFKFDFYSAVDERNVASQIVSDKPLQAGMKHKAGMIVNWVFTFKDMPKGANNWNYSAINHRGYSFWCWDVNLGNWGDDALFWIHENSFPESEGVLNFGGQGEMETHAFKVVNTLGLTDIPVRVTFSATTSATSSAGNRYLKYGFTRFGGGGGYNGDMWLNMDPLTYSFTGNLSPATPNVKFKAFSWGSYWHFMQDLRVEYAGQ